MLLHVQKMCENDKREEEKQRKFKWVTIFAQFNPLFLSPEGNFTIKQWSYEWEGFLILKFQWLESSTTSNLLN